VELDVLPEFDAGLPQDGEGLAESLLRFRNEVSSVAVDITDYAHFAGTCSCELGKTVAELTVI
jgi:hypothetical protein